jgi:hypothetical protein
MNFCQYCGTNVDYGYLCDDCREGVTCPANNLCIACKKFIAERIAQVEAEARDASSKVPSWLRRAG